MENLYLVAGLQLDIGGRIEHHSSNLPKFSYVQYIVTVIRYYSLVRLPIVIHSRRKENLKMYHKLRNMKCQKRIMVKEQVSE